MAKLRRQLAELSAELGAPGVERLFTAARKRKLNVTRNDVISLAKVRAETQIFRPLPRAAGKTATHGPSDSRFMMDLLDMSRSPNLAGDKYAIILVEVFSRYMWARACKDKRPETVAATLAPMLEIQGEKRQIPVISTDLGNEFTGKVEELLTRRGITQKTKAPIETNALGVIDKAMQSLQQIIARKAAKADGGDWGKLLAESVDALNGTTNEAVRDAPEDVVKDDQAGKSLQFMVLKDNAAKFRHDKSLTSRRKKQLTSAGGFRRPIATRINKFQRSYRAKYGDQEEQTGSPKNGTIVTGQGKPIDIKNIQVSTKGSDNPQERFAVPKFDKERAFLDDFVRSVADYIGDRDTVSLVALSKHLIQDMGREAYQVSLDGAIGKNTRGALSAALQLFPEYFVMKNANTRVGLVQMD